MKNEMSLEKFNEHLLVWQHIERILHGRDLAVRNAAVITAMAMTVVLATIEREDGKWVGGPSGLEDALAIAIEHLREQAATLREGALQNKPPLQWVPVDPTHLQRH